ncbi:MAG: orotidine-5'-phosphate decarboxylase [Cellvibrionales bacterium]|nr:orotidine-5'-phosphate decarboxylase [Cellvibrionales bacterium]
MSKTKSPVVVALDFDDDEKLFALVNQLTPEACRLKVGKEVFTRFGPDLVKTLVEKGFDVFLDLKFHDIPNTVAKAVAAAADLGVWMVNVHTLGGVKMMQAAKAAIADKAHKPLLIGVTVLTSHSDEDLAQLGLPECNLMAEKLAGLAKTAGLDGVVCSAKEAAAIKQVNGKSFVTVTPGIRPLDASQDDQHRVMSPEAAVKAGADYLVIGRPITQHEQPLAQLQAINNSLK